MTASSTVQTRTPSLFSRIAVGTAFLAVAALIVAAALVAPASAADPAPDKSPPQGKVPAPDLKGGVAWLNTAGPISLADLKGRIVLLDFWTLCCINCMHIMPDLARLEAKYPNVLVVIGVHTPKFPNEKNTESIRKAILRYEIAHPVVNDAETILWRRYNVQAWPTQVLIDPLGNVVWMDSGEGHYARLDKMIGDLIGLYKGKGLNETPLRFQLARGAENGNSPLFFPGKVYADQKSNRLFIADSTHHRIVITDLAGKKIAIAGTGEVGHADGSFQSATFNDPQGMALNGESLYVADRRNHLIRVLDLANQTVKTIAGTAKQNPFDRKARGPALQVGLNSPWDLYLAGNKLFIAMAGHHQIWVLDLQTRDIRAFAGNGNESIVDGALLTASSFAQPSGMTSDGKTLWVADAETSAIRALPLNGNGAVKTIVGQGLFEFGDRDGVGPSVRLQHALAVAYRDGKLYVADTYNSKLKEIDPVTKTCTTIKGQGGGWLGGKAFMEPAGLSFAGDKLYIADTNAHRIRVFDLKSRDVSTLELEGVEAPKLVIEMEKK
jgi:DNA-binding beta-propeller fold protein YncE